METPVSMTPINERDAYWCNDEYQWDYTDHTPSGKDGSWEHYRPSTTWWSPQKRSRATEEPGSGKGAASSSTPMEEETQDWSRVDQQEASQSKEECEDNEYRYSEDKKKYGHLMTK